METSTHTTDDLISVYGDLLHYVRGEAEMHLASEHDDEDEMCPTTLYERGQAVYDDTRLFRLMKAAPALLEALRSIVAEVESTADPDAFMVGRKSIERARAAIGKAA